MGCTRCNKKGTREIDNPELYKVFGNFKYLTDRQITARLSNYKTNYCKGCEKKESCDIVMFYKCKNVKTNE